MLDNLLTKKALPNVLSDKEMVRRILKKATDKIALELREYKRINPKIKKN